jgi:MlaD protein
MASRIRWSELKIGLTASVLMTVIGLSILLFARVGALHGDTKKLYVATDDVTGVLPGTEVWLDGAKIGLVKAVRFRPITSDTLERITIEAQILADRMPLIRKNARADIKPGGNLIGSVVVYIKGGTSLAPAVKEGDTLLTPPSGVMRAAGEELDTVVARLGVLSDSTQKVIALLNSPITTVGALKTRGVQQLRAMQNVFGTFSEKASHGVGTLGLAHQTRVSQRFSRLLAAKDSIALLLTSGNGNVGRFRRDSTLPREIASVRAGLDSIRALISAKSGSASRLRSDSALNNGIARARLELDSLMKDLKKHPLRYIKP